MAALFLLQALPALPASPSTVVSRLFPQAAQDENGRTLAVFGNVLPNANGSATQGERAFTNSANRTVINSTVASTHNCQGVSCCQTEAPARLPRRWGFCSFILTVDCIGAAGGAVANYCQNFSNNAPDMRRHMITQAISAVISVCA
jgi:hypothetical protein